MNVGNELLSNLSKDDFNKILPFMTRISLQQDTQLTPVNEVPEYAYFPESGIVSVVAYAADDRRFHVGMYGAEGFGSIPTVLGAGKSPTAEFVQSSGYAYRISTDDLNRAAERSPAFRTLLLRFVHVFLTQVAFTALAGSSPHRVDQRLARCLLMWQDRIRGTALQVTHLALSAILGVRRAGITEAVHDLEGQKMIRAQRGLINILDRPRLEKLAADCYGPPEAEYRRLIGEFHARPAPPFLAMHAAWGLTRGESRQPDTPVKW